MKTIKLFFFLASLLLSIACKTIRNAESRTLLKEYALCKCVEYASADGLFSNDISRTVYRDVSRYDLDVYDEIDVFSKTYARKIQPSVIADHEGKKAAFFECFKFFKSRSLDSLAKKMDNKRVKE
ncbi:hypothetical protein GWC95_13205 [Sediminibacterium roseum]|uniref:Lipoprotein n=1 Tax=Sediminibacterium roseum TaxID=1978412 RepID=A0ABW9ZUS9_9BACT|nr:hypothetical protein [Sediminibacterium roseum]NCI50890.1 hypothetical protein [Sediminibacterium roseum]